MAYTKKDWKTGETITEQALDNMEQGIADADSKNTQQDSRITALEGKTGEATTGKAGLLSAEDKKKLDGIAANANNYTLSAATKSALGGVKQAAVVAEASGEQVTKAEFKALLDALKAAGMMANS